MPLIAMCQMVTASILSKKFAANQAVIIAK